MSDIRLVAKHMAAVYGLIFILLTGLALLLFYEPTSGEWVCLEQECSKYGIGGEIWASQNCAPIENGEEFCQIYVDGQAQLFPKDSINLSAIQVCEEYTCLREVKVRNANYTLPRE